MAASKSNADLNHLIQLVTHLQPGTTNFGICLEYAQSNFKHHKFLETNEKEVYRRFEQVAEHFEICAQCEKAEKLLELVRQFRSIPMERGYAYDIHANLLFLLLSLAESPTNAEYIPSQSFQEQQTAALTWAKILEEEPLSGDHWDSDSDDNERTDDGAFSDYSDDDYFNLNASLPREFQSGFRRLTTKPVEPDQQVDHDELPQMYLDLHVPPVAEGTARLIQAQQQIEHGNCLEKSPSKQDSKVGRKQLEVVIVREVLLMLRGISGHLFAFREKSQQFEIRIDVSVHHASVGAIRSCLDRFTIAANDLHCLRTFDGKTVILRAISASLADHIAVVDHEIAFQERYHSAIALMDETGDDLTWSLLRLETHLQTWLTTISQIAFILRKAFQPGLSACQQITSWLSTIYMEAICFEEEKSSKAGIFWNLFVKSFIHYGVVLDLWVHQGRFDFRNKDTFLSEMLLEDKSDPLGISETIPKDDKVVHQIVPCFLWPHWRSIINAGRMAILSTKVKATTAAVVPISRQWLAHFGYDTQLQYVDSHSQKQPYFRHHHQQKTEFYAISEASINDLLHPVSSLVSSAFTVNDYGSVFRLLDQPKPPSQPSSFSAPTIERNNEPLVHWLNQHIWSPPLTDFTAKQSATVVGNLIDEYGLFRLLSTLQAVYLLRSGLAMDLFLAQAEKELGPSVVSASLASLLQGYLLQHQYNHLIDPSFIIAAENQNQGPTPTMRFTFKVEWPLSVLVRATDLQQYQTISDLLQLLWQSCTRLVALRPLRNSSKNRFLQTFYLARLELLAFLTSFRNHVVNYVITNAVNAMEANLKSKELTLDGVVEYHQQMLSSITQGCLLHQQASPLQASLQAIIKTAIHLSSLADSPNIRQLVSPLMAEARGHMRFLGTSLERIYSAEIVLLTRANTNIEM